MLNGLSRTNLIGVRDITWSGGEEGGSSSFLLYCSRREVWLYTLSRARAFAVTCSVVPLSLRRRLPYTIATVKAVYQSTEYGHIPLISALVFKSIDQMC